jgi:hypothetical protein
LKPAAAASRVLDAALARIVYADGDSVSFDHVAADAMVAVAGVLENADEDPATALFLLGLIESLLDELPHEAGHGILPELLRSRSLARVT